MIVVSDTSCLCYLARLRLESVLEALYGSVVIPPAVASELLAGVAAHPEIDRVLHASWLQVRTLENVPELDAFPVSVDRGEAEAIRLAEELHADYLLIDDGAGRSLARSRNIPIIGVVGVLSAACDQGLTGPLRPVFEQLVGQMGFRISRGFIDAILEERGE